MVHGFVTHELAGSKQYSMTIFFRKGGCIRECLSLFSLVFCVLSFGQWAQAQTSLSAIGNNYYGEAAIYSVGDSVKSVATSFSVSSILMHSGRLITIGTFSNGSFTRPPAEVETTMFKAVAAGNSHFVALRANGTVVQWGDTNAGKVPAGLTGVVAVSAGYQFSVALKSNGTVVSWGNPQYSNWIVPAGLSDVKMLAAVSGLTVALKTNGQVVSWSSTISGLPDTIQNVKELVASPHLIAFRKTDGTVRYYSYGIITPPAAAITNVVSISTCYVYGDYNAVLKRDGTVIGWGGANSVPRTITYPGPRKPAKVFVGDGRIIVSMRDGTIEHYSFYNTDDLEPGYRLPLVQRNDVLRIRSANRLNYMVKKDGTLAAWGNPYPTTMKIPTGLSDVKDVAPTEEGTIALKHDGTLVGWGNIAAWLSVGVSGVGQIAKGGRHVVGVMADSTVRYWGPSLNPVLLPPAGLSGVVQVEGGYRHSLALLKNGTVVAWGDTNFGCTNVPQGLHNVKEVKSGYDCNLALKHDGTVVFWGGGPYSCGPPPADLDSVVAIEMSVSCAWATALKSNGKVVFWGTTSQGMTLPPNLPPVTSMTMGATQLIVLHGGLLPLSNDSTSLITGTTFRENNNNCLRDSTESLLTGRVIKTMPGDYYGMSDGSGNYALRIPVQNPARNFSLKAYRYNVGGVAFNPVCPTPNGALLTIDEVPGTINGPDFGYEVDTCPVVKIEISRSSLRPCRSGYTTVSYANVGGNPGENVVVEVVYPEDMGPLSSAQNHTVVSPKVWHFYLGNLAAGQQGSFQILDSVSCIFSIRGEERCISAAVLAPTTCNLSPNWSGAEISLKARCQDDNARVGFYNRTANDMTDSTSFTLYLDSMLVKKGRVKLAANDSLILTLPTYQHFLHLKAEQVANHPFETFVTLDQLSCSDTLTFIPRVSSGQFPQPQTVSRKTHCDVIRLSIDPNDKLVFPKGFTARGIVPYGSRLEYRLRFQNVGNDTAFNVVVVDTLDAHLDPLSLEMGIISHPCQMQIQTTRQGKTFLKWTFANILLPDSNVNEAASHGVIQFRISPVEGLAQGTKVRNKAAIYFDFNPAVITNQTLTTLKDTVFLPPVISGNLFQVKTEAPLVRLYPNPTHDGQIVLVYPSKGEFQLFNLQGQLVWQKAVNQGEERLIFNLPKGMYFANLITDSSRTTTKLLVE